MIPTEVLKMLKSKIDAATLRKCNYAIETSDIEAINQALDVSKLLKCDCKHSGNCRYEAVILQTKEICGHKE